MARHARVPLRQLAVAVLAAVTMPCALARGQEVAGTPEHVAEQFTAALRDTNWLRMASLMHPSALAQFHDLISPFLRCDDPEAARVRQGMFGVGSTAEIARLSDTLLMAAIFRFATSREEGLAAVMQTARMQVLGHVAEGADTVHVLTRLSFAAEGISISTIEVASFRRFGDTWRVLLKADYSALATALRGICTGGS